MMGNLTGLAAFGASVALMLFLVPSERITRFRWMALIGGLGVALLLTFVMQNLLGIWRFSDVDVAYLWGAPLFLEGVWAPLTVAFGHLITESRTIARKALVIGIFAISAGAAHWVMLGQGMLTYHRWSLFQTVLLAGIIHFSLAYYLHLAEEAKQASFR